MEFDLICLNCKHYKVKENKCIAFKGEIPFEIYAQGNDHSEPLPKQENNIVFEPLSKDVKK